MTDGKIQLVPYDEEIHLDFFYELYCDPLVRAASRSVRIPPKYEFKNWSASINHVYMASVEGVLIGYGRLSGPPNDIEISYAIAESYRNLKYGPLLIGTLTQKAKDIGGSRVKAVVKSDNDKSLRSLIVNGYKITGSQFVTLRKDLV